MKRLPLVVPLLGLLLARAPAASADPAPIAARPMTALTGAVESWRAQLCTQADLACSDDPTRLALYRAAGDSPAEAWGILATGPILVKLRRRPGRIVWAVDRLWDFTDYVHSQPSVPDSDQPLAIVPALYPVGPGEWAVAIVAHVSEMYAGGGAGFSVADFVALDEPPAEVAAVYRGVPFSCGKTVRACFTEEEYRRSLNCHDEFAGKLTLSYAPSRRPDRYIWTAVWHERHQPPGAPAWKARVAQQTVRLPVDGPDVSQDFGSVPFCGGGPVSADP